MLHCCIKSCPLRETGFWFLFLCPLLQIRARRGWTKCAGWQRYSVSSSKLSLVAYLCFIDVDRTVDACKMNGSVFLSTWNCGYHSWTQNSLAFSILNGLLISTACTQAFETSAGGRIGPWVIDKVERGRWEVASVISIDQVERGSILNNSGQQIWRKSYGRQQQWRLQAILYTSKLTDPTTPCCPRSSFQAPRCLFHPWASPSHSQPFQSTAPPPKPQAQKQQELGVWYNWESWRWPRACG